MLCQVLRPKHLAADIHKTPSRPPEQRLRQRHLLQSTPVRADQKLVRWSDLHREGIVRGAAPQPLVMGGIHDFVARLPEPDDQQSVVGLRQGCNIIL